MGSHQVGIGTLLGHLEITLGQSMPRNHFVFDRQVGIQTDIACIQVSELELAILFQSQHFWLEMDL